MSSLPPGVIDFDLNQLKTIQPGDFVKVGPYEKPTISIRLEVHWNTIRAYPECKTAKIFCRMQGDNKKTLVLRTLKDILTLGYYILEIDNDKMIRTRAIITNHDELESLGMVHE